MDLPIPSQQLPPPPMPPIARLRGPAIIRKFFYGIKQYHLAEHFLLQNRSIEAYLVHHLILPKHFVHLLIIQIMQQV
jgi:hypothetical protein